MIRTKKNKKNKSVISYWLLGIGILLLVGLVVKGWQMFQGSKWDGASRINFVLANGRVGLASFNPQQEELILLVIPDQTMIEVVHGYGKYRVEAISGLENLEKRKGLLAESLQENLGVPVDGWLRIPNSKGELLAELGNQILGKGETNLARWDLARLWMQVRNLRSDEIKTIDLSKISVLTKLNLPDQTQAWEIDKASLDDRLANLFNEPKIRQESLEIEILNGTSHPGLAEKAARIMTNMGGEVVTVGNSDQRIMKCEVLSAKDKKNSYTVGRIIEIFNCLWGEKKEEGRGEITLILGEDYWQKLNQK